MCTVLGPRNIRRTHEEQRRRIGILHAPSRQQSSSNGKRMSYIVPKFCVSINTPKAHCDSPENYLHTANECFRGEVFLAEAERLWKAQEGRPSLPNIKALLLMCSVYAPRETIQVQMTFILF